MWTFICKSVRTHPPCPPACPTARALLLFSHLRSISPAEPTWRTAFNPLGVLPIAPHMWCARRWFPHCDATDTIGMRRPATHQCSGFSGPCAGCSSFGRVGAAAPFAFSAPFAIALPGGGGGPPAFAAPPGGGGGGGAALAGGGGGGDGGTDSAPADGGSVATAAGVAAVVFAAASSASSAAMRAESCALSACTEASSAAFALWAESGGSVSTKSSTQRWSVYFRTCAGQRTRQQLPCRCPPPQACRATWDRHILNILRYSEWHTHTPSSLRKQNARCSRTRPAAHSLSAL